MRLAKLRGLTPAEFDVVEVVHVVERADADSAFAEGLVIGGHDGCLHVVEEDLDRALLGVTLHFDLVPFVGPGDLVLVLGKGLSRGSVDNHDLAAVRIWLRAKVDVVEMSGVLMVEEDTAVTMISGILRTTDPEGEDKITKLQVLD